MIKILANDGIDPIGKVLLEDAGYQVDTEKIPQEKLPKFLPSYDVVIVRSATKIRKDLIDQCPNLKVIARGGVGLDNIDTDYARSKGIAVYNTPAASSRSVAELVFGHLFNIARFLVVTNREMPTKGNTEFKNLKSSCSKGFELSGKTMGILGFGRIGQSVAKIALGIGMKVFPVDLYIEDATIDMELYNDQRTTITSKLSTVSMDLMFSKSDVISVHVPFAGDKPLIGKEELSKMKQGVVLINAARGGVIDEDALLEAINSGHVAGAGLDVFENEPTPKQALLNHPNISVSPHIGASTREAQANIGSELADKIIGFFEQD